ncbi:Bis(5'-adenosyl)-triphosphatase [Cucumispora dikerogammari]|nr:Bis(5'-adenosyl)-triphosphatase [Cucumispora dikerogammari]
MTPIFAGSPISDSLIIHQTENSVAFLNPTSFKNTKHIIVAPLRQTEFLSDLSSIELHDLFSLIHKVSAEMESDGLTLNIKDGVSAGSNVAHVHMHIVCRNYGDNIPHSYILDDNNLKVVI